MTYTMRRDGSFVVELQRPLKHADHDIDYIVVRAPTFEHTIRWGRKEIPSALALLAELSQLPERLLRQITYPDVDRITFALFNQAGWAQKDVMEGLRPFASSNEQLPAVTTPEQAVVDQIDPRFPHVDGPVRRFPTPPPQIVPSQGEQPDLNLDFGPPETAKAVTR